MKIIRKLVYPITIIVFIVIIIGIVLIKRTLQKNKYEDIVPTNDIISNSIQDESQSSDIIKYNIDIKGAVNNPGVYQLDSNLTVNDVINIAGGLTKDADTSIINLAKKITDEMVIIVYTKEEVKNSNIVDTVIKTVEKECVCPNIQNDGCLNNEITDTITNKSESNLININTATIEELQTISGIGETKAKKIIEYRNTVGKFKSIEDIKNVEGIGDTLYETIKIYITT